MWIAWSILIFRYFQCLIVCRINLHWVNTHVYLFRLDDFDDSVGNEKLPMKDNGLYAYENRAFELRQIRRTVQRLISIGLKSSNCRSKCKLKLHLGLSTFWSSWVLWASLYNKVRVEKIVYSFRVCKNRKFVR